MYYSIIKQVAHCDRNDGSWQNGIVAHSHRTGGSFERRLFSDEPEAANFLIFFIKFGRVTGASDQDIRHLCGRFAHDGSNAADIGSFRAFDDKLIMDMAADLLIGKILHSVAQ